MMEASEAGFRELDHTADRVLEIWGPDLSTLLEQAARGMYSLMGMILQSEPRMIKVLQIQIAEPEMLLVKFLQEILYLAEMETLGFDHYELKLDGKGLTAVLAGAKYESLEKEIKAVTYHNLKIEHSRPGLSVKIVFDV
jgi:SHS2 domain-containing protein